MTPDTGSEPRTETWPEKRVAGLPWPAKCRHCGMVTEDPDAHFLPPDWDADDLLASARCPDGRPHELERRWPAEAARAADDRDALEDEMNALVGSVLLGLRDDAANAKVAIRGLLAAAHREGWDAALAAMGAEVAGLDVDAFIAGLDSTNHSPESRRAWVALFFRDLQFAVRLAAAPGEREPYNDDPWVDGHDGGT